MAHQRSRNQKIADLLIAHQLKILRLAETFSGEVRRAYGGLSSDIVGSIEAVDPGAPSRLRDRLGRADRAAERAEEEIGAAIGDIRRQSTSFAVDVARFDHDSVAEILIGFGIGGSAILADSIISRLSRTSPILGLSGTDWWGRQRDNLRSKVRATLRDGVLRGQGNRQIIQRIRGTRSAGFSDGVMQTEFRRAQVLSTTQALNAVNQSRMQLFGARGLNEVQLLVVLDSRTSDICRSRVGGAWNTETGRPLSQSRSRIMFPGPPPYHMNCRSVLVPIAESGELVMDSNYEDWLLSQSKRVQIEALGKGRFELWAKGKIKSDQLIHQTTLRSLTLDQLVNR